MEDRPLRDEQGRFVPGHEKIGGIQKGQRRFTTKVIQAIEKISAAKGMENLTVEEEIVLAFVKKLKKANLFAVKMLWEYLDGKPIARMEIDDPRGAEDRETLNKKIDKLNEEFHRLRDSDGQGDS